MRYFLFPDEEKILCGYLTAELGLKLLASNLAPGNIPDIIESGIPSNLDQFNDPVLPRTPLSEPTDLLFWRPELGPLTTLGSSGEPSDPKDKVSRVLTREASGQWQDLIDFTRTPLLAWHRPHWHKKDHSCVVPGRLSWTGKATPKPPGELQRLYGKTDRMLRKTGIQLNPFDYVKAAPVPPPKNLDPFWVQAWPQGISWLEKGGELWPWDA